MHFRPLFRLSQVQDNTCYSLVFQDLNNSEVSGIISNAYMELLDWDFQNAYPETLKVSFPVYLKKLINLLKEL